MACCTGPTGQRGTWTPQGAGEDFELSPILAPLGRAQGRRARPHRPDEPGAIAGDGHYVKAAALLTGTTITKTTGKDLRSGGVSMDQLAAQRIGKLTPAAVARAGHRAGDHRRRHQRRLHAALRLAHLLGDARPRRSAKEINPRLAFDRLFRSKRRPAARQGDDRSVLDLVADDAGARATGSAGTTGASSTSTSTRSAPSRSGSSSTPPARRGAQAHADGAWPRGDREAHRAAGSTPTARTSAGTSASGRWTTPSTSA